MAVEHQLWQLVLLLVLTCSAAPPVDAALPPLPSHCYCNRIVPQEDAPSVMRVDKRVGQFATLHCCAQEVVPNHLNATVTWTYNGKTFPWSRVDSQFGDEGCYPQEVGARYVVPTDRGNYTCTYSLPGGATIARTIVLVVHKSSGKSPLIAAISNDTLVRKGEPLSLSCTAYTGGHRVLWGPTSVGWWAYHANGTMVPAEMVPGISVQHSPQSTDGMYTTRLHIAAMSAAMYGVYTCEARNLHNSTLSNVTVAMGVPPTLALAEAYQTATMVVVVCVVVVVVVLVVSFRLRLTIAIALRNDAKEPAGNYTNDVFLVHGETCTEWVMQELVHRLETVHHYTCYVPARDLHGGAALVDELPLQLARSRRVVVVVTACLVRCPWSLWCVEQAVHATLSRGLRVVAVMLQNLEGLEETPVAARLVSRINLIKKIWHPSCKAPKNKKKRNPPKKSGDETFPVHEAIPGLDTAPYEVTNIDINQTFSECPASVSDKVGSFKSPATLSLFLSPVYQVQKQKSDNHLEKRGAELPCAGKKTKSDLYLNLPEPSLDVGAAKSLSLQNQRLKNMVSSTQGLRAFYDEGLQQNGAQLEMYPAYQTGEFQEQCSGSVSHEHRESHPYEESAKDSQTSPSYEAFTPWQPSERIEKNSSNRKFYNKLDLQVPQFNIYSAPPNENQNSHGVEAQVTDPGSGSGYTPRENNHNNNPNNNHNNNNNNRTDTHVGPGLGLASSNAFSGRAGTYSESVAPYKPGFQRCRSQEEATEPDTPCSGTPFILPEQNEVTDIFKTRRRDATVVGAVWVCCASVFTQTPQQRFWQRLLLQLPALPLPPPSASCST